MQIRYREGEVSRCAEVARRSAEDDTECESWQKRKTVSNRECGEGERREIGAVAKHRRTERDDARKVFGLWRAVFMRQP
jgi:hypothetical protein